MPPPPPATPERNGIVLGAAKEKWQTIERRKICCQTHIQLIFMGRFIGSALGAAAADGACSSLRFCCSARNTGQGIREGSISFYIFGAFFYSKTVHQIKPTIFIRKVIRNNNNNENLRTYLQFDSC